MKTYRFIIIASLVALTFLGAIFATSDSARAAGGKNRTSDPAAANYTGHKGVTLYVSKLGDNSDGTSWKKAFHTVQAALSAVPDDKGGHRIIIRPDRYMEDNLSPKFKGAAGSYNEIVGDIDGSLGSGAVGWVVLDCSDPKGKGMKSYDWWGNVRAMQQGWSKAHTDPTFSSIIWDRWYLRKLYATGGDGAFFWDLTSESGKGFTVRVEDCVSIGRAFGGGFSYPIVRKGEPIEFRRTYFAALDWWGDAGAIGIGGHDTSMPEHPHAVFEDCTMISPDNAVQVTNPSKYVRVKFKNCRMIVLNFSQPRGTPSTGIICSHVADSKYLHMDFEDCTLMGYKVFGAGKKKCEFSYTTKGRVAAYVQYTQTVPKGFIQLKKWPVELFDALAPPKP